MVENGTHGLRLGKCAIWNFTELTNASARLSASAAVRPPSSVMNRSNLFSCIVSRSWPTSWRDSMRTGKPTRMKWSTRCVSAIRQFEIVDRPSCSPNL